MKDMAKMSDVQSQIRATVANALASALICGIDECEENDRPLTQLQKIDLAKYSIMNYDQAQEGINNLVFADVDAIRLRIEGGDS